MFGIRTLFLILVLVVLPLAAAQADPPPPCTCELCLADPGVKCNWKVNGSCVHLLRSGVCLGQLAGEATPQVSSAFTPVCQEAASAPSGTSPALAEPAPRQDRRLDLE